MGRNQYAEFNVTGYRILFGAFEKTQYIKALIRCDNNTSGANYVQSPIRLTR